MGDDPEFDRNQLFAKASWEKVASAIVYFNEPQSALSSPKTRFIPSEPYPFLRDIVDLCADQEDWCAIINADIWIHPAFARVEQKLKSKRAVAASSWRFEFDPEKGVEPCERIDNGMDFFAATPAAWGVIYEQEAPNFLKLGCPTWDSWLQGAFFAKFSHGLYDISDTRCVRHPKHGGRKHGAGVPPVHFLAWPVMGVPILQ